MAVNLLTNPSSTPTADADWTNFVAREDVAGAGGRLMFCSMQLTQRGTTTVPAIAQGGTINVGGSWYQADSDTALTNDTGLSDGTVHIKLVPLGTTLVPTLTSDSMPAWDAEKNGFYDSDDMFLPYEMTRSGAITKVYTDKFQYAIDVDKTVKIYDDGSASFDGSMDIGGALTVSSGVSVSGNLSVGGSGTLDGITISTSSTYVSTTVSGLSELSLPVGMYIIEPRFSGGASGGILTAMVKDGSGNYAATIGSSEFSGGLWVSDGGVNFRLFETGGGSIDVRYRKLT